MKLKHWIAFLALVLLWGSSFLWIRIALDEVSPVTLVAFRLFFGAVGLLAAYLIMRPPLPTDTKIIWLIVLLGLINNAIPFLLISWGQQFIDSGVASVLNASVPLFTLVIAHFFLEDERINLQRSIGVIIGFVGILVLFSKGLGPNAVGNGVIGQLAVIVASAFYAGSTVLVRKEIRGVSPIVQALIMVVIADLIVWPLVPLLASPIVWPSLPITWIALIFLGLLGSCLAYLLFFYLINETGATKTTMVTYAIPVVAVVLGIVVRGEALTWQLAAGGLLILVGIAIVNNRSWKRAPQPAASGASAK